MCRHGGRVAGSVWPSSSCALQQYSYRHSSACWLHVPATCRCSVPWRSFRDTCAGGLTGDRLLSRMRLPLASRQGLCSLKQHPSIFFRRRVYIPYLVHDTIENDAKNNKCIRTALDDATKDKCIRTALTCTMNPLVMH